MLKKLEENVGKVKNIMCEQNGNIDKEIENLKRNQMEILELKNKTEMKSSQEGFKSRFPRGRRQNLGNLKTRR